MARQVRWQVPFKSISNKQYYIDIYDDDWTGAVTTLTGGEKPIVINEDSADDMFKPVRTSSGNISLYGGSELQALIPQYATQRYVRLRDANGGLHWHGYIKPETFSMDWHNTPTEVEFPVISPIGVLEGVDIKDDTVTLSLAQILRDAISETKADFVGLVLPLLLDSIDLLLGFRFIRGLWLKDNSAEDDGTGDWTSKTGDSYLKVLEDVCRFWGLQLREWKGRLVFVAFGGNGCYEKFEGQDFDEWMAEGSPQSTTVAYSYVDFTDFSWESNNNKESVLPGKKKVVITADFGAQSEIMKVPAFDTLKHLGKDYYGQSCQRLVYPGKGLMVRQFAPQTSATDMRCVFDVQADINDKSNCDSGYPWDLSIVHLGAFAQGEMLGGCLLLEQYWGDEEPHHLSFTDRIYIKGRGDSGYAIKLVGNPQVIMKGAICLKAQVQHKNNSGLVSASGHLKCMMRVGNYYYTGNTYNATTQRWTFGTWQRTPTMFSVNYDGGSILDTNNIRSDYDSADGFIMPIDSTMGGEIYICIYGDPVNQYTGQYQIAISGLQIDYCPVSKDISENSDRNNNVYAKMLNKGFNDEYSVDLNIASYLDGNKNGVGYLLNSGDRVAQRITYHDGEERIPENELLGRMCSWFGHTIHQVSIDLNYTEGNIYPFDILQDVKDYHPLSFSYDYINDIVKTTVQSND